MNCWVCKIEQKHYMVIDGEEICTNCVKHILKYVSRNKLGFAYLLRQVAFDTNVEMLRENERSR